MTKALPLGKGVFFGEWLYCINEQKHEMQFGNASISVSSLLQSLKCLVPAFKILLKVLPGEFGLWSQNMLLSLTLHVCIHLLMAKRTKGKSDYKQNKTKQKP